MENVRLVMRACLLVAECGVEAHDGLFFLPGEHAVLQPRPQVVNPSQPAALAVSLKPCNSRQNLAPTPLAKVHLTKFCWILFRKRYKNLLNSEFEQADEAQEKLIPHLPPSHEPRCICRASAGNQGKFGIWA